MIVMLAMILMIGGTMGCGPKIDSTAPFFIQFRGFAYSIDGDDISITRYLGKERDVIIPDKINDLSVTSIGCSAFHGCYKLKSVVVPWSVINICDSAFRDCGALEKIIMPDGVKTIGSSAFYGCLNLKSVILPSSVVHIGSKAFVACKSLTSVTIHDGVETIGEHAFVGCDNLTSITIPGSVTGIGSQVFNGGYDITIGCYKDSYAHYYCITNGLKFELL